MYLQWLVRTDWISSNLGSVNFAPFKGHCPVDNMFVLPLVLQFVELCKILFDTIFNIIYFSVWLFYSAFT